MAVLDKTDDLLEGVPGVAPEKQEAETPRHLRKVVFMTEATAGGKAAVNRSRPPGSRFNRPTQEELEAYAASEGDRKKFIANDPVVRSASNKDSLALLATLKAEVAREAAALAQQRVTYEQMGKDISTVSSRRIDALKKIADIEMEMRKIGFDQIDVHGEKFQKIFKLWLDTLRSIVEDMFPPEQVDLFFNRLATEMEDWADKAEDLVR
jgi:hypothetical protein